MKPEDPRHGTNAGYIAHALSDRAYCDPCREAMSRYRKQVKYLKHTGRLPSVLMVDSTGTRRRIQALLALGHTHAEIAAAAGLSPATSKTILAHHRPTVHTRSRAGIARAYAALSMTLPQGWRRDECRQRARALGYLPPLAWDDIDDPDECPVLAETTKWTAAELAAEWDHLRRSGLSIDAAAARLGLTRDAIEKAVQRARRAA